MPEVALPEEIAIVSCGLMGEYLRRLQVVVHLMVHLRADLIKQSGIDKILNIDIEPYYQALRTIQMTKDDLGFLFNGIWNNEWRWRLHGIGCGLTNINTGEVFDWDAHYPYDLSKFWDHLSWRIENEEYDSNLVIFVRWQAENKLSPFQIEVNSPHYWKLEWPTRDLIEAYMLQENLIANKEIDGGTLLFSPTYNNGQIC